MDVQIITLSGLRIEDEPKLEADRFLLRYVYSCTILGLLMHVGFFQTLGSGSSLSKRS